MEKLWSPWRSQYIDSFKFKDKNKKEGCVFCELAKEDPEEVNNLVVDKGKLTFTVLNLYPYNNGHLMIVPFRHTDDFSSLTGDEKIEVMDKLQIAEEALRIVSSPEAFNGDTNFMPVLGEVKVISQDLLDTKKKLLEAYKKLMKK
jgi:ATP adenylyltransferase